MNTKSVLSWLLILAVVSYSAQGLKIKNEHQMQAHNAQRYVINLHHSMNKLFHLQSDEALDPSLVFVFELLDFISNDEQINKDLEDDKLSPQSQDKVMKFVKANKAFSDMISQSLNSPDTIDCIRNLSEEKKKRLVQIMVDNFDLTSIAPSSQSGEKNASQTKIQQAVRNDQLLGQDVVKCLADNKKTREQAAA